MSGVFAQPAGATALTLEEMRDLIPSYISNRDELNAAEQANILQAQEWALGRRREILSEKFVLDLHRKMLGDVWRWAGKFRTSERNLGIDHWEIRVALRGLLDDVAAWIEFGAYSNDEIAVRLHHKLVVIHPFVNGNGRHARLMADLLAMRLGEPRFRWGRGSLGSAGELRRRYIEALQEADRHEVKRLVEFARG